MKNNRNKLVALILCALLTVGGGVGAYAAGNGADNTGKTETGTIESENEEAKEEFTLFDTEEQTDVSKDETVYVLADSEGGVNKIIVSDWLKNSAGVSEIGDTTSLDGIENIKGDETFSKNGDKCAWNAAGNDIYYEGTSAKALPLDVTVSYYLDGKKVKAGDIVGKSGEVRIRFDYKSKLSENKTVGGEEKTLYVPFTVMTGTVLDNEVFTDVNVVNGKIVNDGDRTTVVGIAFPGLREDLGVAEDKLDIPEYFEITAKVKDFAMPNTVTVATNEVFSKINTDKLDSLDEMTGSIDELKDGMNKLLDGSSALKDGLNTLAEKSGSLTDGAEALYDGASSLADGTSALADGASELSNGTKQLLDGMSELSANSDALRTGASQVFDSLLSAASAQIKAAGINIPELTQDNYAAVLDGVLASVDTASVTAKAEETARAKVTEAVEAERETIEAAVRDGVKTEVGAKVTAAVKEEVTSQVLASLGMTTDTYTAAKNSGKLPAEQIKSIEAAIDAHMNTDSVKTVVETKISENMESEDVKTIIGATTEAKITEIVEEKLASDEVRAQIASALESAAEGAKSIASLKEQLGSYKTFYDGLCSYTYGADNAAAGANALNSGAVTLADGAKQLDDGVGELKSGIGELKDSVPELIDGIEQLRNGSEELYDGLCEFNERGIEKLVDAFDGNLSSLGERLNAVKEMSGSYDTYSGKTEGMSGTVKFIYRTEAAE